MVRTVVIPEDKYILLADSDDIYLVIVGWHSCNAWSHFNWVNIDTNNNNIEDGKYISKLAIFYISTAAKLKSWFIKFT